MVQPKISDTQDIFRRFVGTWRGEETLYPTEWNPDGAIASSQVKNQLALNGFLLIQDLAQSRDGQVVFRAHNLFRWDEDQGSYVLYWFDTMGNPPNELHGQLTGDVLTFTGQDPGGHSRLTYDFSQDDQCTSEIHTSADAVEWQRYSRGIYRRI